MRTQPQFFCIRIVLLICFLMAFVANTQAQDKETESVRCDQTDSIQDSPDSHDCKNRKEYKRNRLVTKKISPEVRTETLQRDREFDLNKLYPFLVRSGVSN